MPELSGQVKVFRAHFTAKKLVLQTQSISIARMQELLPLSAEVRDEPVTASQRLSEFQFAPAGTDPGLALRFLDAFRVRLSHSFDHLSSLSNSRTRLLAHQIEAAHTVVNALRPRFLIADEVGLGKTIEAGLIIKELMFRRGYHNILICVPAPLVVQWQSELRNRFNEEYTILQRSNYREVMEGKTRHMRIITSIDFIKNPRYAESVLRKRWDLAVFDEAHRLRRDYNKVTVAYAFAEQVAEKCEALMLLSATPFRGKLEELFYLIRLIDPHVLGPLSSFLQEEASGRTADLKRKLSQVLIRRRKVEVGGFTKRHAQTIRFELSPEERAFYDETTEYVRREYNLALAEENRAVGFVMLVFQKLLDSSTRALMRALTNRKMMLERLVASSQTLPESPDESEWEDQEAPEELVGRVRDRRTWAELRKEILTINRLLLLGRAIETDRKLIKTKETLQLLKSRGTNKFVIFTQFKSTVDYLCENLTEWKVIPFHGSLRMAEKEQAIADFKDFADILICTEAGGEGRNLQFSNVLINYDLPWSPLKIEQRIGRVHRFGQTKDVYIFNFATRDTVSERVLEVLTNKIKLFEESIGASDALLGAVQDEVEFQRDLMEFITNKKTRKELNEELAAKLKTAESGYSKLHTLVSPSRMNFNWDDYYGYTKRERSINSRTLEKITSNYLADVPQAGSLEKSGADYLLQRNGVRKQASFDSERALERDSLEFLALGHPLVEEAVDHYLSLPVGKSIHAIRDSRNGYYFIYSLRYSSNTMELTSVFCSQDKPEEPLVLPDLILAPGHDAVAASFNADATENILLRRAAAAAAKAVEQDAETRRLRMEETLKTVFRKEELKVESSHNKHLKGLREKQDIQKMRATMHPVFETRASLAKTEKEISRTQSARQIDLERIRRMSKIKAEIELLQIYRLMDR
ncbi:MAG TPA: SNF2-related protein [Leptospiraceae bacterium]|nr:DEAD/DEAH box helicase family protein [Leptospirales bacterium]HMU82220.1 SNF2-related protein [Leptospiraceae bacterium]HMW59139.1 SNF2-related protein [Leptospiraceae bacterium]HMX58071.1 SNF2-related protein [Leptospiraceae bacterium]HMY45314.1 SNF2-related protein [Leptospiraceae bacterium]